IAPFKPVRLKNLERVGAMPWLLAAFLALLGLAAVMHALVMSVRHRRREIATLRSLGMLPRQVRAAVAAQATITVLAGAMIAFPLGLAAGRLAWGIIANGLGVVDQ